MKSLIRTIYLYIPFKKFFFLYLRKNFNIRESIYKHLWFRGFFLTKFKKKKIYIYSLPTIIENEIFWNGLGKTWEPLSLNIWSNIVKKKNIIFDIGANTGIYSLVSCALNSKSKTYAFEPNNNFTKAIYNSKIKNRFNIKIENIALSNKEGFVNFDGYQIKKNKKLDIIKTIRLDNFIKYHKIKSIDLMKIDVELHEPEVIEGMGVYLKKFKPDILIEVLNNNIAFKLNKLFENLNYYYISIDDKKNILKKISQIKKSPFYNILICKKETYSLVKEKFNKNFI